MGWNHQLDTVTESFKFMSANFGYRVRKIGVGITWIQILDNMIHPRSLTARPWKPWWLEDDPFLLGFGNFSAAMLHFGVVVSSNPYF